MSTANAMNGSKPPSSQTQEKESPKGTLTRQDLAMALYNRLGGISHREAKRLADSVIDEMVETLTSGETLKLHDFGSFVVRSKHERAGRNPRTGEPVPIQARRVIVFKASPNMKAAVNGEAHIESKPAKREKKGSRKSAAGPSAEQPSVRPLVIEKQAACG